MKKAAKKKPAKVKSGIFLKKSSKGFSLHLHSKNENKLAVLTGYNTKPSALKGLLATYKVLKDWAETPTSENQVIDLTKK